jgi:hypothetical protein
VSEWRDVALTGITSPESRAVLQAAILWKPFPSQPTTHLQDKRTLPHSLIPLDGACALVWLINATTLSTTTFGMLRD